MCIRVLFSLAVSIQLEMNIDIMVRSRQAVSTYGGVDPLGVFPLFIKMVTDIITTKLSIIFLGLIRRGSFLKCWPSANATAIPKGAPSPDRDNYRPISMTLFCLCCMRS